MLSSGDTLAHRPSPCARRSMLITDESVYSMDGTVAQHRAILDILDILNAVFPTDNTPFSRR